MKQRFFSLLFGLAAMTTGMQAQVAINATNFPDENFRNWLLDANNINGYGADGTLTAAELADIKEISVVKKGFKDLTGIGHFTALEKLECGYNELTSLDLSANKKLTYLYISNNPLVTLDISQLSNLEHLLCGYQDLSVIDFTKNTKLKELNIFESTLTSIDVSMLPELETLYCYMTNQLTTINVSKNTKLKGLSCDGNQLTTLDVSNNPNLEWVSCSSNLLTTLDFSNNPNFTSLECWTNKIRGAGMDALINSLPAVTKGTLVAIRERSPEAKDGNEMTKEQVAAAKAKGWQTKFVDSEGWYKDYEGVDPSAGIAIDATNFPDPEFRNWLMDEPSEGMKGYGVDGVLTAAEIADIHTLFVSYTAITNLKGIEFFTELDTLFCDRLSLTSLDVSQLTKLKELGCEKNQLTSLNVSGCTELVGLYCYNNQLTSLDVSTNTKLRELNCMNNRINEAEMGKLVESLPTVSDGSFYAMNLDNENEGNFISKEQVAAATAKGWTVKALKNNMLSDYEGASKGLAIDATNFPDENFRNWLLDAANINGYGQDAVLTDEEIADIKNINVEEKGIKTLKGIEYFTALENLTCYKNKLSALDVTKNTKLISLYCDYNSDITELDLSQNTELDWVYCGFMPLTSIDFSKNTKLTLIGVTGDKLTSLDVSMLPDLECILCSDNQLTSLDISKNPKMTQLNCDKNKLTILDVSHNPALYYLACFENQLTTLDLSNNPVLTSISCEKNLIRGAGMDALVNSLPTVSKGSLYVYNEEEPTGNEMTTTQVAAAKAKGWQPQYFDASEGTYGTWKDYEGTSGISSLTKEQQEGEWYTLDGRRVVKPTRKGVYINNGKVVIK